MSRPSPTPRARLTRAAVRSVPCSDCGAPAHHKRTGTRGQPRGYPSTNLGWHDYYVRRFNLTQNPDAAYLACLYLMFHLAFGDERIPA